MKQPFFSILIANYNNGKYLMEAIESVRQQTYGNWEIVLVDDASTDNSEELYVELEKDERIRIYRNKQNMGCGYTKRRCAELAKGDICGYLDPDDVLTNDALQVMVEAHLQYPKASLIYSPHIITDEKLNKISSPIGSPLREGKSYLESPGGGPTAFSTYKNDLYKKTEGINPELKRAVDQDVYLKMEEVGELKFVNQVLYLYRQGTGLNISLGTTNARKALCWDMLTRVDACKRRGVSIDNYAFNNMLEGFQQTEAEGALKKEKEIRRTKAYRIGSILLAPFRFLRNKRD